MGAAAVSAEVVACFPGRVVRLLLVASCFESDGCFRESGVVRSDGRVSDPGGNRHLFFCFRTVGEVYGHTCIC